jgi:uncharacterized peroxidase-related enzyme
LVATIRTDYSDAEIDQPTQALLDYSVKLTREPWSITATDVQALRDHGFSDEAIHDAVQVVAYFNYINRVCDGLGIEVEDFMPAKPADWVRT